MKIWKVIKTVIFILIIVILVPILVIGTMYLIYIICDILNGIGVPVTLESLKYEDLVKWFQKHI